MKSVELSQALAAAMSLRLPGTVGKIANKVRYIDSKAPLFLRSGIIRSVEPSALERVHAVGISSKSRSMPALGGVLYGAAAIRHDVVVVGGQVQDGFQDARVDINDMNYLDASERLVWKEYLLVYRLLTDVMDSATPPSIIFMDLPLLVPRGEQSLSLGEADVQEEWDALLDTMETFWQRFCRHFGSREPMVLLSRSGPTLSHLSRTNGLSYAALG